MKKVPRENYKDFVSLAAANSANRVYPLSVSQMVQTGDIYTDADAVLFHHYCGFGYITGEASERFLNEIFNEMISSRSGRRLVIITDNERVSSFFGEKGMTVRERIEYKYAKNICIPQVLPDGFETARIDEENISEIKGRIIPSFSWESGERFLTNGYGYVALHRGKVCAVSFSSAVSSDEVDIGVETRDEYRGKGLASALSAKMCEHILNTGKRPVWAHDASNTASMKTALKCGFTIDKINKTVRAD
ncbi:MAG: GNAT family N-acetyltransferase [Clostridia bacterium]|nr:GNAT family N-acetyltransferase [Clostridia bacterium]